MNKQRRKRYEKCAEKLRVLLKDMDSITVELAEVAEEEREAYDNLPESIQTSDKGETLDAIATELEEIKGELEDAYSTIEGLADRLENCEF